MQHELIQKYRGHNPDSGDPNEPREPDRGPAPIELQFGIVDTRPIRKLDELGRETVIRSTAEPTPWHEIAMPELATFLGPTSFFLTQFATGELEYPWVWALVVAYYERGRIHAVPILDSNFDGSVDALQDLVRGVCAESPTLQSLLATSIAALYALGAKQKLGAAKVEGRCVVVDYRVDSELWRAVATEFGEGGCVAAVHAFNPVNVADQMARATACR